MKKEDNRIENAIAELDDLAKQLTNVIADLHGIKGSEQTRHAYCYYRHLVWEVKRTLEGK